MKGYKAFNRVDGDNKVGICRGMEFKEGETYTIEGELKICKNGLHFCKFLVQTFEYYDFNHDKVIYAEVEALGDLDTEDVLAFKYATNKLKIIRFLSIEEVDAMFSDKNLNTGDWNTGDWNTGDLNTGDLNTGNRNTGDWNTGNRNTGNHNTGYFNTGDWNTGDWNTGNRNTGNRNTGYFNTGNRNTGNRNTGDWNTGDWNTSDNNTGFFNTEPVKKIRVFNVDTSLDEWNLADKPNFIYFNINKEGNYKDSFIASFNETCKNDIKKLLKLPNFDYKVFEEISGITKEMIEQKLAK